MRWDPENGKRDREVRERLRWRWAGKVAGGPVVLGVCSECRIKLTSGGESACVGGNHPNVNHILSIFLGVIVCTLTLSLYTSDKNNAYSMFFTPASMCIFMP